MKLVVDSNVIFSALIKNSLTRKIINHLDAELTTIKFFDEELRKYLQDILEKSGKKHPVISSSATAGIFPTCL